MHVRIQALMQVGKEEPEAPAEVEEIKIEEPQVQIDVDPEDPNRLTLKQVHDWLFERLQNQQAINVDDASVRRRE